jgi:hypothetical protein
MTSLALGILTAVTLEEIGNESVNYQGASTGLSRFSFYGKQVQELGKLVWCNGALDGTTFFNME